jgi:DNA-binding SARP family transcriptional activator/TolB-like protein
VLGSFALTIRGRDVVLPRKAQALLALLALRGNEWQGRDAAADILWDDRSSAQVRQSLRQCLWVIRRECDCELLEARRGFLRLPSDNIVVDAQKLEASAATANLEELSQGAILYRGALLEGFPSISSPFNEWLNTERARFAELAAAVFTREAEVRAAAHDVDAAIAAARRLVSLDDLNERSHRLLISLLARAGRRLQALEQFEVCAATLRRELKVTPDAETVELARSISAGASEPNFNASIASDGSVDTELAQTIPKSGAEAVSPTRSQPPAIEADRPPVDAGQPGASWVGDRRWLRGAAVLAAVCITEVVIVVAAGGRPVPAVPNPPVLLVVPFTNNSTIGEDWLAAGVSSLIAEELREAYSLRVSQYRPEASDAVPVREHIAAAPAVRYVLDGTASFYSPLDIGVHLDDRNGATLWSDHYARPRGGLMDMVVDIATHVSRAVDAGSGVFGDGVAPVDHAKQTSRELLALASFMRRDESEASLVTFQQIVKRATALDSKNPEALALLSGSYLTHFAMTAEYADLTEADHYLDSALALDQTNVGALWDKCFLRRMQGRYVEALELCRRVLDINAHHAGALREVGHDLVALHDPADAIP